MSLLVNATPFEVTYSNGNKDTIDVKELSIRELYQFVEHVRTAQTFALVGLCCSRNGAWVDSLSIESYGNLAAKCMQLNFHRAVAIAKRDPVMARILAPVLIEMGQTMDSLEKMAQSHAPSQQDGTAGVSPSPTPSSLESSPAPGSAS